MAQKPKIIQPSPVMRHETWLKTASVAGNKGDFATVTSGYALRAVSTTKVLIGIINASWTNDATNDPADILVDELGIYQIPVTGATLAQATHVGNAYDLSTHILLDLTGTSHKPLVVVGVLANGDALVRINKHISSGSL